MTVTQQSLLDSMDGIAMILDHELCITQIGRPNWNDVLDKDPPQDSASRDRLDENVIGRPFTQFIAGNVIRSTFADLFNSVLSGRRRVARVEYRCDAPKLRRDMRFSVSPIQTNDSVPYLLYQSIMLSSQPRPPIPLFAAPVADHDAEDILTLCAICARVAWPLRASTGTREWTEPAEYYRRGGGDVTLISHGFCEDCFTRLQEED